MCFSVSIQSLDKFDLRVFCRTCWWIQSVLRSHRTSNTLKHLDSPLQGETFPIDRRINILHSSLMQSTIESCYLLLKHILPSCLPTMLSEVLGESLPYLGKLTKTWIACHSHQCRRNSTYLSKSLTKSTLDVLVMCLLHCVLQISSYSLPISLKKLSTVLLDSFWFSSIQALPRHSHEGFVHDVMESNTTIIPASIKNSCNWTLYYRTRFDAKVPQTRVLEALANTGQQGAGCVEYSHPQHDIFESFTLFSLDLSCLNTVFCQRRERCSLTWASSWSLATAPEPRER